MKLNPIMVALPMLLAALAVKAQTIDLGPDATELKKFLVYPHLQKGFEAMEKGNKSRAIAEFEQARSLAPNSPAVAAYLAEAHRRFGERARAELLLAEQLTRHQGNPQINKALNDLRAESTQKLSLTTSSQTGTPVKQVKPDRQIVHAIKKMNSGSKRPFAPKQEPNRSYVYADMAYKASAKNDFEAAVPLAQKAVQLAPNNRNYRQLLIYVLTQNGSYGEADALIAQMLVNATTQEGQQELTVQQEYVRRHLAFQHFDASNKALASGNIETAISEARRGSEYAPGLLPHRLQHIGALIAAGRIDDANLLATEAIQALPQEPALLIMRGYTYQRQGKRQQAWSDFDLAIQHKSLTTTEQQNFRIISAQAALAADEPQRTLELLAPLDASKDEGIVMRRKIAQSALQRSVYPNTQVRTLLSTPGMICVGSSYTPACDIWPGEEASDAGRKVAESAYKALASLDYTTAATNASDAVKLSPSNANYRLLLVNTLVSSGKLEQADQNATQFLASNDVDVEMLAARSGIRQRLGRTDLANEDAAAALRSERLSLVSEIGLLIQLDNKSLAQQRYTAASQAGMFNEQQHINVAYLAALVGDDTSALSSFDSAASEGTLPVTALQDAAYAAGRLGRNNEALKYFKQTIDAAEAGRIELKPQQLFETRREIADRSRTWGFNSSLTYRGISSAALAADTQLGAAKDSMQGASEVYWRPLEGKNKQLLEVYGGVSATLSSKAGYPTGSESVQGTLGARVKPISDTNLVFALERRFAIGSKATNDWLPRLSYSTSKGTDLRVDAASWMTTNVYAEVGRYVKQRQSYASFEGQVGRSFRLDAINPKLVVFPHTVLGADYNSSFASGSKGAVGAGLGANLRFWFNEDRYNAPLSYVDVSLQYRKRISGDDRAKGVFLRATLTY